MNANFTLITLLFFSLLFISVTIPAHENGQLAVYKKIIISSISSADTKNKGSWAYRINKTLIVNEDKNITVENFLPHNDLYQQWQLEKINNKSPSEKQLREYEADKKEEIEEDKKSKIDKSLLSLIELDSLKITNESHSIVSLSFKGFYPKFGDNAKDKIEGMLTLDTKNNYVSQMKLKNNDEFTTNVILNIEQWQLILLFNKNKEIITLKERQLNMQGTLAIFKGMSVNAHTKYSDYQLVEEKSL
jgi:hypothetical protein